MKRPPLYFFIFAFSLSLLSGCGYHLYGKKDIKVKEVKIGKIENTSREPRLEDLLKVELSNEIERQGLSISNDAPYQIHGNISHFELIGTAESGEQVFREYEIRIVGTFFLLTPEGKDIPLKGQNPFIVTFSSSDPNLSRVFAQRQMGVQTVLKNLAAEIVSSLVYAPIP